MTCKLSLISNPLPSLFALPILQFIQKFGWREGKIWRGGTGDGEAEKCLLGKLWKSPKSRNTSLLGGLFT